ncbi:hypothetical protein WAK64_08295 [Bacillus spongiae]|uniref:DUF3278 domain-containing protein n=1 Tax=Bacillus spongiae TaxID=2683610 RepID=A0ABU8HCQ0_9BACI
MFIEREDGNMGFVLYGPRFSKWQYIITDEEQYFKISKIYERLMGIFALSIVIIFCLMVFIDFTFLALVVPVISIFYSVLKKSLAHCEKEEHNREAYKVTFSQIMEEIAESKNPIIWFMALISGLFFSVLIIYPFISDIINKEELDSFYLWGIPFILLLTVLFALVFVASIRKNKS